MKPETHYVERARNSNTVRVWNFAKLLNSAVYLTITPDQVIVEFDDGGQAALGEPTRQAFIGYMIGVGVIARCTANDHATCDTCTLAGWGECHWGYRTALKDLLQPLVDRNSP